MARILVIEDDKLIRWSLKEIFLQEGHTADAVATEIDALQRAEQFPYPLILADLELENVSSIELLKNIQKIRPEANLIILSSLSQKEIEPQLSELSIYAVVEKPFNSDKIRELCKEALDLTYKK